MINSEKASFITKKKQEKDKKNATEKVYQSFLKYLNKKIKKGEFNFNDFITQLESVKKLGSMKSLIGMIPGLGNMANQLKDIDLDNSNQIKHIKAMISSMTPKERENPDLLNNARKRRIAAGAGLDQITVNRFLKQFSNAAKLAKKFSNKDSMKGFASMMANANRPR